MNILLTLDLATLSSQISETNFNFETYMNFSAQKKFNFSDIHIQVVLYEISKLNTSLWDQIIFQSNL
jgi:hypothetical protein